MTHTQAIQQLRLSAYHKDAIRFTSIVSAHRIKPSVARQALKDGKQLRAKRIQCGCNECRPKSS